MTIQIIIVFSFVLVLSFYFLAEWIKAILKIFSLILKAITIILISYFMLEVLIDSSVDDYSRVQAISDEVNQLEYLIVDTQMIKDVSEMKTIEDLNKILDRENDLDFIKEDSILKEIKIIHHKIKQGDYDELLKTLN